MARIGQRWDEHGRLIVNLPPVIRRSLNLPPLPDSLQAAYSAAAQRLADDIDARLLEQMRARASRSRLHVLCRWCGRISVVAGERARMARQWPGLKCQNCETGYLMPPGWELG